MKFQSKYRNHSIVIRPFTYEPIGQGRIRPLPGLVAKFVGPTREFDLDHTAKELQWSDEDKQQVLEWLLSHKRFMVDFFPAAGYQIPEELEHLVKRLPREKRRFCRAIGETRDADGNIDIAQCKELATAGRDYCAAHDPEMQKIVKGVVGGA